MGNISGVDGTNGAPNTNPEGTREAQEFGNKVENQKRDYVVRSGDTMSKIAKREGISLRALLGENTQFDANSVDNVRNWKKTKSGKRDADCLKVGEKLTLPGLSTGAGDGVSPPSGAPARAVSNQTTTSAPTSTVRVNTSPQRTVPPVTVPASDPAKTAPVAAKTTEQVVATGSTTVAAKTTEQVVATGSTTVAAKTNEQGATPAPTPNPADPDPKPAPPEILPAPYKRYLILNAGGSGSKDPRSADNRLGAIFESNDANINPNNGNYQFAGSLTTPGRVQEPGARLDATARVTVLSVGRKPVSYLDANGKEKTTEALGIKFGAMKPENRFVSVSGYANAAGLQMGAIERENGAAVDRKTATSPVHLGFGASVGNLTGFYGHGIGKGQIRNPDGTLSTTHTNVYGVDYAMSFADKPKFSMTKLHFGMTGRRTVTTPVGGQAGDPTFANNYFAESFFKVPGRIPTLLPGQPESRVSDANGTLRLRLDTPFNAIDPKLTVRFDKPIWEVRNVVPTADGKLEVKSQLQMEAMSAVQFGLNSQKSPAVQNFVAGLRFRF